MKTIVSGWIEDFILKVSGYINDFEVEARFISGDFLIGMEFMVMAPSNWYWIFKMSILYFKENRSLPLLNEHSVSYQR